MHKNINISNDKRSSIFFSPEITRQSRENQIFYDMCFDNFARISHKCGLYLFVKVKT